MKRTAGNILIWIGIGIIGYLIWGNNAQETKTSRLIEQFEQLPFRELNEKMPSAVSGRPLDAQGNLQAILNIPKIDLIVPVVEGSGAKQLKTAVGHLEESGELGKSGNNYAIAGHRSATFGQFFNRLDELKVNDRFTIWTDADTYTYTVTSKTVVKPTDVHVIDPVADKSLVTLITCHPFRSNKQRLIIKAERVESSV